jgi:hypothetical protein
MRGLYVFLQDNPPSCLAKITRQVLLLGTVLSPVVSYTPQRGSRDAPSSHEYVEKQG